MDLFLIKRVDKFKVLREGEQESVDEFDTRAEAEAFILRQFQEEEVTV